jgi:two-component system chemotaxis response regulator CheB
MSMQTSYNSGALQPGNRIRVVVVDDSVVIRSLVTRAFQDHPRIEIVGTAPNGSIGLAKVAQLQPDVITLDIEMPGMSGLEMLRKLREKCREPFVIMFSTLTEPGALATLDALMLGADDYITKPSNSGSLAESVATLRSELGAKILQFVQVGRTYSAPALPSTPPLPIALAPPSRGSRAVLAIGVSTGGPNALSTIVRMLPKSFSLPVLIVQHMPPLFTRLLAERLQKLTPLLIEEATHGCTVQAGKILIAPGGFHMRVGKTAQDVIVLLDQSERRNSCRPSVDVLFESVNKVYGDTTIAAILTGMGQDGLQGVQALRASGAYIIAQDEMSSVVWGMPGFVVRAGLANSVVPLDGVVPEVLKQCAIGASLSARGASQ